MFQLQMKVELIIFLFKNKSTAYIFVFLIQENKIDFTFFERLVAIEVALHWRSVESSSSLSIEGFSPWPYLAF